jgi:outer membrane protein assembly factor BamB
MFRKGVSMRLFVLLATASVAVPAAATDWLQFGFDASHSGVNPHETALTPQTVADLKLKYSATLPGRVEGAPVYLAGVETPAGVRDMLYVTLRNGTLVAVDAPSGDVLWSRSTPDPDPCVIEAFPCFTTSSPAIDPNRQFVYNYALDGRVHKYRVGDGEEVTGAGWPQLASLKPDVEAASSALAFATAQNGTTYLYVTFAGAPWLPDFSGYDYQGHVTAIDLGAGTQVTFNVACSDLGNVHFVKNDPNPPVAMLPDCEQQWFDKDGTMLADGSGGIWGRGGVTYDPANDRIYLSTGNGLFDANNGGHNWSDSVLALPAALDAELTRPLDSYTPINYQALMYNDVDLGATTVTLVPAPPGAAYTHIGVQAGKDSYLRIIDLDDMSGQGGPGFTAGELFVGSAPQGEMVITQPLVWINPDTGAIMLIAANNFGISASEVIADAGNQNRPAPRQSGPPNWVHVGESVQGSATSTGGTSQVLANGVLYYAGGSGVLALDPATGATLWQDTSMGIADASTQSSFHKQSVIVVDGRVYVADDHGTLWAYQLDDTIFGSGFENAADAEPRLAIASTKDLGGNLVLPPPGVPSH